MAGRVKPAASTSDVVAEVAATVMGRLDPIANTMIERYQERIDYYQDAPEDILEDAREWAKASITIATGIITGALDIKDFIDPLTDVGRRRAAQGFPLHDVLQANLIGTEVLWETVWALAPDDPADRAQIASVMMKATIELLQHAVTALSTGYQEVAHGLVADEEHDMQTITETLAGIRKPDKRHEERARLRGVDLAAIRWCLVSRSSHEDAGLDVRSLRRSFDGSAVGRIGQTIIAYLPGDDLPKTPVKPVGAARANDPERAFKRARATLEVAIHLGRDCVCYEDVVPLAMILGGPTEERDAFVQAQLGPLLRDPLGEELVKTLAAYYAAGQSVAAAARELYVHRHTLEYRLQRIGELLGRDVRANDDRLLLELAIAIRRSAAVDN